MKLRAGLMLAVATPLILVDLGLLVLAWFVLGSGLLITGRALPSFWPAFLLMAFLAVVYLAGLGFVAADALQHGLRGLRTPGRLLRCSLFGLAMNLVGAVLGVVVFVWLLVISGSIF